jgi:hypothetical protein
LKNKTIKINFKINRDLFVIRDTKGGFDTDVPCIIISGLEADIHKIGKRKQKLILEMLLADLK